MTNDNENLPVRRTQSGSGHLDAIVAALKAGATLVDPVTGALASLVSDFIPSERLKRLEEYAAHVGADLRALEGRVDKDFIKSDHFAFMFEQCFRGAAESYQEEKLAAFRGILVNAAIGAGAEADDQEYMLSIVNRLTALHLKALTILANVDPTYTTNKSKGAMVEDVLRAIEGKLPDKDEYIMRGVLDDLYQANFISQDMNDNNPPPPVIGGMTFTCEVTEHGRFFLDFITSPIDADEG